MTKLKQSYKNLYTSKGETFRDTIRVREVETNASVNITNTSITGAFWQSPIMSNSEAEFEFSKHDSANGIFNVYITSSNTSTINIGTFVYAFHYTDESSDVHEVQNGLIHIANNRS